MMDERSLGIARRLTISYIVASTAILAASGLLGVVLRWSQAVPQARVGDNFWYAMMTAHGLGAFVGWGALRGDGPRLVGPRRRRLPGARLRPRDGARHVVADGARRRRRDRHDASSWASRASWVFLYPLPFYGSGNWGDWATGLFSFSVLLAGPRDRDLVLRDPAHGDEPRGAPQRLELDRQAARPLVRLGLPDAPHVRHEPEAGAVPGDPARRDRARHDHRDAPARRAAGLADPAVDGRRRPGERPAREEHPLVVRPPGRLPPALPRRRRLLLADPALRRPRPRRGPRDRRSPGRSP